jgi:hypothetical protein
LQHGVLKKKQDIAKDDDAQVKSVRFRSRTDTPVFEKDNLDVVDTDLIKVNAF